MLKNIIIIIIIIIIIFLTYNNNNISKNNNIKYNNINSKYIKDYNCNTLLKIPIINTYYTTRYFYYINSTYLKYFNKKHEKYIIKYNNYDFNLEFYPNIKMIKKNKYPIIIIGKTVSSCSKFTIYQSYLMMYLYKNFKINTVRIDFRGYTSNIKNYLSCYQSNIDDVNYIIKYIYNKYNKNLYLLGFSLSGNLFINFYSNMLYSKVTSPFVEAPEYIKKIKGVILLSTPLSMNNVIKTTNKTINNYSEKILINHIQNYFKKNEEYIYDNPKLNNNNIKKLKNLKNINEFYNNYIKKINNNKYKNIKDWSNDYNILYKIKNIKIPILIIHSDDDNICKIYKKDLNILKKFNNIKIIITKFGGHCGFFCSEKKLWYKNIIGDFINNIENKTIIDKC